MILYTKNNCSACMNVKNYLDEKSIDYSTVNIQQNNEAGFKLLDAGIRSVPVLERDGEYLIGAEAIKAEV